MGNNKPLCKWDKDDIKDNFKELKKIVSEPRYVCRKCARVAKKEEWLCKPEELDSKSGKGKGDK